FTQQITIIFIKIFILTFTSITIQARCLNISQTDAGICEVSKNFSEMDENILNDIKTTTISQKSTKTIKDDDTNNIEKCSSSSYNLQDKLINLAIENLLDLHKLNRHINQFPNEIIGREKRGHGTTHTEEMKDRIKKRSIRESKDHTFKKHKKSKRHHSYKKHRKSF
ncbi:hypothetical protein CVS40_7543, partial [Lucilia cuprina]